MTLIKGSGSTEKINTMIASGELYADFKYRIPTQSIQAATLLVSLITVLLFYPFIQRYFIKGIMIGAIRE